jgi:hypothetical protein
MTKFDKTKKIRLSDLVNWSIWFWQFQNRIREWAKHEIWRSKYVWNMKKRRKNIKELIHVLTTKFDILRKSECPICQTKTSDFYSNKKVNISIWRLTLYISQVGPCRYVCQVMHMFLEQFNWISLKKQRSAWN